ncbi:MAG: segregation/condensation protein A [bacterium]
MIKPREDLVPSTSVFPEEKTIPEQGVPEGTIPESDRQGWHPDQLPPELEYFRASEAYQVDLESFQGPLDLLLYLIQKDQIDIYDIPISNITTQFLQYLELITMLSLDNAGDFLVMAATLLRIKARLLLPVQAAEELTEEDPRAELVQRLLEYKRFKEAAAALREQEEKRRHYHLRQTRFPFLDEEEVEPPLRIEMFELLRALSGIFDRIQTSGVHAVRREPYTVDQKIELIREKLAATDTVRFQDLFADDAIKMEVIVTFIAILELVKRGVINFFQTEINGPIWLRVRESEKPSLQAAEAEA